MKHDPNSKVRSQRENMQAFQLRLPKEVIKDLQILRVFGGVKVSEELRDLVCSYVESQRGRIQQAAQDAAGGFSEVVSPEQQSAADYLVKVGEISETETRRLVAVVKVDVDESGNRVVKELPVDETEAATRTFVKR